MEYRSVDQIRPEHRGHRVTVRRRLPEGGTTDVVGICEHADIASVTVRTHNGERMTIGRGDIVAARVVEAPPLKHPENPAPG
ncbi:MAG: putative acetyltransferase [Actinomycetota bacterium]